MNHDDALALHAALLALFEKYGLHVGVGVTGQGVAIRSQDERVDAINIGAARAHDAPITGLRKGRC